MILFSMVMMSLASMYCCRARSEFSSFWVTSSACSQIFRCADAAPYPDAASRSRITRSSAAVSHRIYLVPIDERAFSAADLAERWRETIGEVYTTLGDFDAALENLDDALRLRRNELGEQHPEVAKVLSRMAVWLRRGDRFAVTQRPWRPLVQ